MFMNTISFLSLLNKNTMEKALFFCNKMLEVFVTYFFTVSDTMFFGRKIAVCFYFKASTTILIAF